MTINHPLLSSVSLYLANSRVSSTYNRLRGLYSVAAVCILLLIAGKALSVSPNAPTSNRSGVLSADTNDTNGPTVSLSYDSQVFVKSPTSSFMYFIPLISPTLVETQISTGNKQQAGFTSYEKKVSSDSFSISCEFDMVGKGFFEVKFDPEGMVSIFPELVEKNEPITKALDYIKFEGEGFGRMEVKGKVTGSTQTVTEVEVYFNARGKKSPVTIGLYSIKPEDGQYKYENKYNEMFARVAKLKFKKYESEPRMGVEVVSVNNATGPNGYLGRIKGIIANFFINPIRISALGNNTMLDFGDTILKQKTSFTFPKAHNITKIRWVTANNNQQNTPAVTAN